MIRMGGADAMMLSNETPSAYMHTFKVAILDLSLANSQFTPLQECEINHDSVFATGTR